MIENPLKEVTPPARITTDFLNTIIRRIECTKPLAGSGITIAQQADGISIQARIAVAGEDDDATLITLTVCKNGSPATIRVLGYDP